MSWPSKYYEAAYSRLRNSRPTAVSAVVDGEAVDLSIKRGASKGKWERVLKAAQQLKAEALQTYDAAGGLLEVIELCEPRKRQSLARDDEDDDADARMLAVSVAQFEKVMAIALDAADRAVQRQGEQMASVTNAALELMRIATERLERSERALDKVLRAHGAILERGNGKASAMDDFAALMAAAKASGFDVERFFGAHMGGRDAGGDDWEEPEDDTPAITPDHISAPRKQ